MSNHDGLEKEFFANQQLQQKRLFDDFSASPRRGPNRFVRVLDSNLFEVPLPPNQSRTNPTTSLAPPQKNATTSKKDPPTPAAQRDPNFPAASFNSPVRLENLSSKPKRYLTAWVPKIVNGKLVVEGYLVDLSANNPQLCKDRWLTSKVIEVVPPPNNIIVTKKTSYYLEGKLSLQHCDASIPRFIRDSFLNGFPAHWKDLRDSWRSFLADQMNTNTFTSETSWTSLNSQSLKNSSQHSVSSSAAVSSSFSEKVPLHLENWKSSDFLPIVVNINSNSANTSKRTDGVAIRNSEDGQHQVRAGTHNQGPEEGLKIFEQNVGKNKNPSEGTKSKNVAGVKKNLAKGKTAENKSEIKNSGTKIPKMSSTTIVTTAQKAKDEKREEKLQKMREYNKQYREKKRLENLKKETETSQQQNATKTTQQNLVLQKDEEKKTRSRKRQKSKGNILSECDEPQVETRGQSKSEENLRKSLQSIEGEKSESDCRARRRRGRPKLVENQIDRDNSQGSGETKKSSKNLRNSKNNDKPSVSRTRVKSSKTESEPTKEEKTKVQNETGKSKRTKSQEKDNVSKPKVSKTKSKPEPLNLLAASPPAGNFNPNPRTVSDLQKNSNVLQQLNKNHDDDYFQHGPVKKTRADVVLGVSAICQELFQSDSENDQSINSIRSAKTPIGKYFDGNESETFSKAPDADADADHLQSEKKNPSFQQHAFIKRKMKENETKQRIVPKKSLKASSQPKTSSLKMLQNVVVNLDRNREIDEMRLDELSNVDEMESYFSDNPDTTSMYQMPAGLLELYHQFEK